MTSEPEYIGGLLDELSRAKRDDPHRVPLIVAELQRLGHPIKPTRRAVKPPEQTR